MCFRVIVAIGIGNGLRFLGIRNELRFKVSMHGIVRCPVHEFQSLGTEQHRSSASIANQVCFFFKCLFSSIFKVRKCQRLNSSTGLKDSIQQLRFVSHKSSQDLKDLVHINQNAIHSKIMKHRSKQSWTNKDYNTQFCRKTKWIYGSPSHGRCTDRITILIRHSNR